MKPIATFTFPPTIVPTPNIQGITGVHGQTGGAGVTGIQGIPGPAGSAAPTQILSAQVNPITVEGETGYLHSYKIPIDALSNVGDYLKVCIWVTIVDNGGGGSDETIWQLSLNSLANNPFVTNNVILNVNPNEDNTIGSFWVTAYIIKTASDTQTILFQGNFSSEPVILHLPEPYGMIIQTYADATSEITYPNSITESAMIITKGG